MSAPAQKMSPSSQLSLIGFLCVLASLAAVYFLVLPRLSDAVSTSLTLKAQDDSVQNDIKTLKKAEIDLATAKQQLTGRGVNFTVLGVEPSTTSLIYPPTEDMPSLYIQMESLMGTLPTLPNQPKPSYQLGKPALDSGAGGSVKIPLTVAATGTYANLKTFMSNLETNVRPISLSTISLSQSADPSQPELMSLSATGFVRAAALSPAYASSK